MSTKTAYLWGPISSFSGSLAALLLGKGWHVHVATKGAFHFSLSPLDLRSAAQNSLKDALGGHDQYRTFQDRLKFLDVDEVGRGTKYDALIFCGLPPNFDESRVSRAPWAAAQFGRVSKKFKGVPAFIISSLWGAVQQDGVVPEEIECERRKPLGQFEAAAQQYERQILKELGRDDAFWYLVRLPMISGSSNDGKLLTFSGPLTLFEKLAAVAETSEKTLNLTYNPDGILWFLPVDAAVNVFWKILEDNLRPRICNLVSTQATLNREWLQNLASALGLKGVIQVDEDGHNLPGFLYKALNDNINVKTRGLFEVMGRYQQLPIIFGKEYFEKVIRYGRSQNWGKSGGAARADAQFSEEVAKNYFLEFLPAQVDTAALKNATADGTSLCFKVDEESHPYWVLKTDNGRTVVEECELPEEGSTARFYFKRGGMMRLINRRVSLERALVTREARVEGKPMDVLRACNFLKRFLKEHPYSQRNSPQNDRLTASSK